LGRLLSSDAPGSAADVSYSYDPSGNRLSMTSAVGTTTWSYDRLGRIVSIQQPTGAVVGYGYDAGSDLLTQTTAQNGTSRTVTRTYDGLGRLSTVVDWDHKTTGYTYDALGREVSLTRDNGVVSTNTYDPAGRLAGIVHTNPAGVVLAQFGYSYDADGNITQAAEGTPNVYPHPSGFEVQQAGYQAVALAWPGEGGAETGYELERSTDGTNWQPLAELAGSAHRYG
jgi:YD repeat-containing protein